MENRDKVNVLNDMIKKILEDDCINEENVNIFGKAITNSIADSGENEEYDWRFTFEEVNPEMYRLFQLCEEIFLNDNGENEE